MRYALAGLLNASACGAMLTLRDVPGGAVVKDALAGLLVLALAVAVATLVVTIRETWRLTRRTWNDKAAPACGCGRYQGCAICGKYQER